MNWTFYRKLHERGMDTKQLAAALDTSHGHISQVVNGKRGLYTRWKLARLLTEEERAILGWDADGNLVPQGTLSHDETNKTTN